MEKEKKSRIGELDVNMEVIKEVMLECAHKLLNHKGKCKNLHGHSYKVILSFTGKIDKETGMIMDFSDIPTELLKEKYDHTYLNKFMKNPTAENFLIEIKKYLNKEGFFPNSIEVWETNKCRVKL